MTFQGSQTKTLQISRSWFLSSSRSETHLYHESEMGDVKSIQLECRRQMVAGKEGRGSKQAHIYSGFSFHFLIFIIILLQPLISCNQHISFEITFVICGTPESHSVSTAVTEFVNSVCHTRYVIIPEV